jgi:hypothetical protein
MSVISTTNYIASGSRTSFYHIGRGRGFKTFYTKQDAEVARSYQIILNVQGFAPKVYSEVGRIKIGNELSRWGYITQKAKTLGCSDSAGGCDCDKCSRAEYKWTDAIDEMRDLVAEECGVTLGDCHLGNFGIIGNRLVVIDTGVESFNGSF